MSRNGVGAGGGKGAPGKGENSLTHDHKTELIQFVI